MVFPRDMVCLRNISVDTLHKEDTDDDDDNDNDNDNIIIIIIIDSYTWNITHNTESTAV